MSEVFASFGIPFLSNYSHIIFCRMLVRPWLYVNGVLTMKPIIFWCTEICQLLDGLVVLNWNWLPLLQVSMLIASYLTMKTSADSTNIWKLTAGGRIVPRFQELSPEKLGKVSIFCTYFYFSNKEYARVKDVVYWCSLTHFLVPSYMNLESW